ncbi:hypothetical protein IGI04_013429 [Brassica rapa subsp. trilocularis]|uniref:Uncharacterized protein n=2 Tax=Brassica campestris TaxID=3711 RepID=A0ABQ7N8T2_BRACM|nr:hypothetical protein IGI04_013429 [Brassica rapa subsp. trilocularis]
MAAATGTSECQHLGSLIILLVGQTTLYRSNLAAAQMERSSTFRETIEHPVSSSRSTSPLAQTDVTNFFQCLRFNPKVVAADHKSIRHGDFKRHVNIALGIQGDESPPSTTSPIPEEIKRLKAGLRENNVKARERVKIFNEASSVFNKFFPTVPTKKRSRPEGFSSDRLALGPGLGKMGFQGQTLPGCFEFDEQNVDQRPKSGPINKRTRTSMMDVRSNAIVRAAVIHFSAVCQHGAVNGVVPYGRSDSLSRQTGLAGSRDSDHNSLYNEKRERAINKSNIHDESNSSSPKINVTVRGPRSGSGLPPKLSPVVHNTPSPSNWDISGCTNKPPLLSGVPSRKRMTSNRSSSPPVTQWASQRPQKISRVARRTSLVPFVSSNDDIPSSDNMSDVGCSETSFGFPRRSPSASPRMRLKGVNSLSTTALSGSEEFSPPEIKSKDKGKQSDEVDVKATLNVRKLSVTGLQSRKNKLVSGEELGDGVRRQGRTGRGFGSTRSVNPMGVMRHGTTKQLRSARNSSDKNERIAVSSFFFMNIFIFIVVSDDGHEELLAAVNSAINFALSGSKWSAIFFFISDAHINFVKQLGDFSSMSTTPVGTSSDLDGREKFPEGLTTSRVDSKASHLYQRSISALISEDSASVNEDLQFDGFGADAESEFSALNHVEFNGYRSDKLELDDLEDDGSVIPLKGVDSSPHNRNISNVEDEGIVDEIKTLEEAVYEVIANFATLSILKLKGFKKKEMLNRLLTPALEMKELQEKEFDRLGYEKLIEMAYEKSKTSRLHHSGSGKSSANKISKQAAFAFVKRTLGRCRQFEETGKSCFSESTFKNILVAGLTQIEDNPTDKEDTLSASTPMGSQPSSSLAQNRENYTDSSEHTLREGKDETMWLNRTKERELLLDDVCGTPLSSSTKGKRSDRDKDGASSARGGGTNKIGRPALSNNAKGERKSKTKPKQKATSMFSSPSVSILEQNRTSSSKPTNSNNSEYSNLETLDETEPLDLSGLQIPDGLGGPDDFDAQAGDLSSWLNIDDDALQDNDIDLLGLQIPMDDLSDLKMMV